MLLTDLSQANAVLALEETVSRAAEAGAVSEPAGIAWIDGLRAASETGQFFAAVSGFMVAGRKP